MHAHVCLYNSMYTITCIHLHTLFDALAGYIKRVIHATMVRTRICKCVYTAFISFYRQPFSKEFPRNSMCHYCAYFLPGAFVILCFVAFSYCCILVLLHSRIVAFSYCCILVLLHSRIVAFSYRCILVSLHSRIVAFSYCCILVVLHSRSVAFS